MSRIQQLTGMVEQTNQKWLLALSAISRLNLRVDRRDPGRKDKGVQLSSLFKSDTPLSRQLLPEALGRMATARRGMLKLPSSARSISTRGGCHRKTTPPANTRVPIIRPSCAAPARKTSATSCFDAAT